MKKIILGTAIGTLFLYFSLRGLDMKGLSDGLSRVKIVYFIPIAVIFFIIPYLRSLRWGIIISPIKKISQKELFPIACIGFMAIILVPMRFGELIRPYLLKEKLKIPFSSGLATIFVERILDVLIILFIFIGVIIFSPLPDWFVKSGYTLAGGFVVMMLCLTVFYLKTDDSIRFLQPIIRSFPHGLKEAINGFIYNLAEGVKVVGNPRRLLAALVLSILIWGLNGAALYILFFSHSFGLPIVVAFIVLVALIAGISMPTAPGMLGNFQYPIIATLSLFGVPKDDAFIFSMLYYIIGLGIAVLLGMLFLPSMNISFKDAFKSMKNSMNNTMRDDATT